ncbi:hypothetical protein BG004_005485 [Podila humilis]|nr:hypothetical protein BG004_005485 [Podila humilis]
MHNNAHLIRHLAIDDAVSIDYLSIPCQSLTTLKIYRVAGSNTVAMWHALSKLVQQNKRLHTLVVSDRARTATLEFWSSLSTCPFLKVVTVQSAHFSPEQFVALWNSCRHVQKLTFHSIRVEDLPAAIRHTFDPRPEMLELNWSPFADIELVNLCPRVESIAWYNHEQDCEELLQHLSIVLRQGEKLKSLQSLSLSHAQDRSLSLCVLGMKQAKKIRAQEGDIGVYTLDALSRHFGTLQSVHIPLDTTKEIALACLESCSLLTYLYVDSVSAQSLIESKPWKALRLESLHLGILIENTDEHVVTSESRSVFERLSKLTELRNLTIREPFVTGRECYQGLDLRVGSGLDKLATIKGLEFLDFDHTYQNMAQEDIAWMNRCWPELDVVLGACNSDGEYFEQPYFCEEVE